MRPRLKVAKRPFDHIVDYIGNVAVSLMIALPIIYWNQLPDIIPSHFNFAVEPDDYGSKWVVVTLPLIGIILFTAMRWIVTKPHIFNYATMITEENAEAQYTMVTRLLRVVNTIVASIFAYLTYAMIHTALGNMSGPGNQFVIILIVLTLGLPLTYLIAANRKSAG